MSDLRKILKKIVEILFFSSDQSNGPTDSLHLFQDTFLCFLNSWMNTISGRSVVFWDLPFSLASSKTEMGCREKEVVD